MTLAHLKEPNMQLHKREHRSATKVGSLFSTTSPTPQQEKSTALNREWVRWKHRGGRGGGHSRGVTGTVSIVEDAMLLGTATGDSEHQGAGGVAGLAKWSLSTDKEKPRSLLMEETDDVGMSWVGGRARGFP